MKHVTYIIRVYDDGTFTFAKPRKSTGKPTGNRKRVGWTKLKEQQVRRIYKLIEAGKHTNSEIGRMYDVSCTTITNIHNRKTWAHLV